MPPRATLILRPGGRVYQFVIGFQPMCSAGEFVMWEFMTGVGVVGMWRCSHVARQSLSVKVGEHVDTCTFVCGVRGSRCYCGWVARLRPQDQEYAISVSRSSGWRPESQDRSGTGTAASSIVCGICWVYIGRGNGGVGGGGGCASAHKSLPEGKEILGVDLFF